MSGSRMCSSQPELKAKQEQETLQMETSGRYIGPMPVDAFLNKFLPTEKVIDTQCRADLFKKVTSKNKKKKRKEKPMYEPFIEAIEEYLEDFEVIDSSTASSAISVGETELKPDITIYANGSFRRDKSKIDFTELEMSIEVKRRKSHDPFSDADNTPFEKNTEDGKLVRGQITAYATAQLGKQFRLFAFSIVIVGEIARILRWDRSGATVTRAFDYVQNPALLIQFFQRFTSQTREGRGWDPSVTRIDETCLPEAIPSPDIIPAARNALDLRSDSSMFCIQVPASDDSSTADGSEFCRYIGGRPPCPYSLIGRSTRAWRVFNVVTKRIVFLKDTWRIDADDIDPEGVTYRKLHAHNVPNIATVEASGDVGYRTVTQSLTHESWSKVRKSITGHIHYRLVLQEVGNRLDEFRCTRELVTAVRDSIRALAAALRLANILHRDISFGNIVIFLDEQGYFKKGLLIDWDLCKDITKLGARRRDRTGTWQFMSAALLRDVNKQHTIADDLESSLHVLTWTMLRYVPHKMDAVALDSHLRVVFDEYSSCTKTGGSTKGDWLGLGKYIPARLELKRDSPLLKLLRALSVPYIHVYGEPHKVAEHHADLYNTDIGLENAMDAVHNNLKIKRQVDVDLYNEHIALAKSPEWFEKTMDAALNNKNIPWPEDDGSSTLSRKRARSPSARSIEENMTKRHH
ncbi:hypothetical protein V8B97DRAFT_1944553 [Scleroderma yunnanense]